MVAPWFLGLRRYMRFILIFIFIFYSFAIYAERELGVDVPGVRIEDRHFKSTASIEQIIKYFRKHGVTSYTLEKFDAPGLRVVNLKSLRKRTRWESINIYSDRRYTYIYVIKRKK